MPQASIEKKDITICGAGLVGSLLGCILGKEGHNVKIYERRPDLRNTTLDGGRSINLALSNRGWRALELAGVKDTVAQTAIPMYRRVMHAVDGSLSYQPYGKEDEAIYSVSRSGLNAMLMDAAEAHPNVEIHFDQKCESVSFDKPSVKFRSYASGEKQEVQSDLVFGTDGAFSAVRKSMQKTDRFNYSQEYIEHGYKELSIPPNEDGTHKLEREALHIWPRGNFMLIALPNPDGSFTCTLFLAFEGTYSFANIGAVAEARNFFAEHFPDALALMSHFDQEWAENPTSSLVIIRCFPWSRAGKVAILGDASHAIVPFYGQGMNSGFEDCSVFYEMMQGYGNDWKAMLEAFESSRKPNADAIADLAMRNFVEMRDLTGQPEFLLRKKIEKHFANRHPDKWTPLYSMVTFSHIPYAEALAEGQRQDAIMAEVMKMDDIEQDWDSERVEQKILSLL